MSTADALATEARWFGHPRGLMTLFFTEMWERFSYYGMRALLILYMTAEAARGGLGYNADTAGAVYGLYTGLVFLLSMPGGWIADRLLGQRKAVLWGGVTIACGHFTMALPGFLPVPETVCFYFGMLVIILGTGLLKPNISVIVGQLYSAEDARRDGGFSIFYMGINVGAFGAPLLCGYLGQRVSWHYGFGLAGVGMVLGLVQYVASRRHLGTAGIAPGGAAATPEGRRADLRKAWLGLGAGVLATGAVAAAVGSGRLALGRVADAFGLVLVLAVAAFFLWLFLANRWSDEERKRLYVIALLFLGAALFWSAFEQAGSSLNLFAERSTDNRVFGYAYPASWFQSLNSLFIIVGLAPLFAWLWVYLARRGREPGMMAKFSVGLLLVGVGYLVMVGAALLARGGVLVSPWWLFFTYLIHTVGEMCLSPVGLSSMSKLAPARVAGLMMGVWFLGSSAGNFMAGYISRFYETIELPSLFGAVATYSVGAALLFALLIVPVRSLVRRPTAGLSADAGA